MDEKKELSIRNYYEWFLSEDIKIYNGGKFNDYAKKLYGDEFIGFTSYKYFTYGLNAK